MRSGCCVGNVYDVLGSKLTFTLFGQDRSCVMAEILQVDPRDLYLSPSREEGADPGKLSRQISRFGKSTAGMPPIEVYRDLDERLIIYNGVTRATRIAKLCPGDTVEVEVIGDPSTSFAYSPTVREKLP
jgi:hypothetical protein